MEKLYAISLRGKMLYFTSDISEEKYKGIEALVNEIDWNLPESESIKVLTDEALQKNNIRLTFCPICCVFRVRKRDGYPIN